MDSSDLVSPCPNRAIASSFLPNCAFVPLQFTRLAIEKKMFFSSSAFELWHPTLPSPSLKVPLTHTSAYYVLPVSLPSVLMASS